MTATTGSLGYRRASTRRGVGRHVRRLRDARPRTERLAPASGTSLLLIGTVVVLNVIGVVMVLSASSVVSLTSYGSAWYFFQRQLVWTLLGGIGFAYAIARRLPPVAASRPSAALRERGPAAPGAGAQHRPDGRRFAALAGPRHLALPADRAREARAAPLRGRPAHAPRARGRRLARERAPRTPRAGLLRRARVPPARPRLRPAAGRRRRRHPHRRRRPPAAPRRRRRDAGSRSWARSPCPPRTDAPACSRSSTRWPTRPTPGTRSRSR